MNIIDENFVEKSKKEKTKMSKIILIIIAILVIAIIGIIIALGYIDNAQLKVTVDGQLQEKVKDMLVFDGDTVYISIRDIASYVGYQSYSGDYAERSEAKNKCYIQNDDEIANFVLGSNKIYKLETQKTNSDYTYFYAKKLVKAINGKLYISSDGFQEAFNSSFIYNQDTNRIKIYTMNYLISSYQQTVLDKGFAEMSSEFHNEKSIFEERLVVQKDKKQLGVIDLKGNTIIEPKYEEITYIPETGDFFAKSNGKVGIISKDGTMKVQILYDSLNLMDKDAGIYEAQREGKYGIIDVKGNIKLYIENDAIGLDISKFEKNDIRNKYLLVDNLIPVKKNDLWGLVDKTGKTIVDFKYDSLGYIASSNKDALNLLVIPNYNMIVTCKDKKYGLINSSGEEKFPTRADDIYMVIDSGTKYYYLNFEDQRYDVEKWLDSIGVKAVKNNETKTTTSSSSETTNETSNTTQNNSQTQETTQQDDTSSQQETSENSEQNSETSNQ